MYSFNSSSTDEKNIHLQKEYLLKLVMYLKSQNHAKQIPDS